MVPFAGYQMPVQYAGVLAEHNHTRTAASLFDVSHMGQLSLRGSGARPRRWNGWCHPTSIGPASPAASATPC